LNPEGKIIDADGHILEPPDLWEKYLEPKYRPDAVRLRIGRDGYEFLEIAGHRSKLIAQGQLGNLGGMGKKVEEANRRREQAVNSGQAASLRYAKPKPEDTYVRGAAFGTMDMKERLQLLDQEGMVAAVLYPTLGLFWDAECNDPELPAASARAYNRWITDFCRDSGGRLIPIAHLSLGDPDKAARELERAVKAGCRGAFVAPFTISRRPHGDPAHDRFFAAAQDCDVPVAIHPTTEPAALGIHHRYDHFGWAAWYYDLFAGQPVQHAFATFFSSACSIAFRACAWSSSNRALAGSAISSIAPTPSSPARRSRRPCGLRRSPRSTSRSAVLSRPIPTNAPSPD
jgi:predicted TIM-barrel fold metal-dependent hydrolase